MFAQRTVSLRPPAKTFTPSPAVSCSLGCTQSHKIYCEPKRSESATATTDDHDAGEEAIAIAGTTMQENNQRRPRNLEALGSSSELQDLFTQYPRLRSLLYDIYKTTLEEEWVEFQPQPSRGRGRGRGGRGGAGAGGYRNRGQWTREKGFNRGLGKVRKLRERCDAGLETGKDAEGFMRFVALVDNRSEEEETHEPEMNYY